MRCKNNKFLLLLLLQLFLVHSFCILFYSMPLVSATDKDKVFEQLCARFDGVKSLRIHFKALNQRFSGVLTFARPDKFRVEFYSDNKIQRIIVSNGKSLWNYVPEEGRVVVSTPENSERVDLQNLFADLCKHFNAYSLAKEINSQLGSNLVLHLRLKEDSAQNVKIYLDSKLQIKAIAFSNGRESAIYQIKKINLNVKTTSSTFDFSPPKDTEVIDLR